jgi:hypothetical protein
LISVLDHPTPFPKLYEHGWFAFCARQQIGPALLDLTVLLPATHGMNDVEVAYQT